MKELERSGQVDHAKRVSGHLAMAKEVLSC
jgi:hypothetical protein